MGRYLELAKQVAGFENSDRAYPSPGATFKPTVSCDNSDLCDKSPSPSARPIDPTLVAQVDAALRRGQWVRVETDFGDIILAPNRRAAERAVQRHPNLPIFRPAEWKELLACETPEELAVLIELKRSLGADLIRAEEVS